MTPTSSSDPHPAVDQIATGDMSRSPSTVDIVTRSELEATVSHVPRRESIGYEKFGVHSRSRNPLVPGYEIVDVLGRGGMGVVYKARHLALKRYVALRMILARGHAGPSELARLADARGPYNSKVTCDGTTNPITVNLTVGSPGIAVDPPSGP